MGGRKLSELDDALLGLRGPDKLRALLAARRQSFRTVARRVGDYPAKVGRVLAGESSDPEMIGALAEATDLPVHAVRAALGETVPA